MEELEKILMEHINAKKEQLSKIVEKLSEYSKVRFDIKRLEDKLVDIEEEVKALFTPDIESLLPEDLKKIALEIVNKGKRTPVKGNARSYAKPIIFEGREYKSPSYFFRKYGIVGGIEGLKRWAEEHDKTVQITEDKIIIL